MKTRLSAFILFAAGLLAGPALAADHTLKVRKTVEVSADAAKTWKAVKDFGGLHTWHPAVEKTDIKSGGDNKVGTVRVLTLKGGGTITETLTAHSDKKRSLSYRIDDSPLPVTDYQSTLTVKPSDSAGKATVIWRATFKAKQGSKKADAQKTMDGVFAAGLDNLKKQLGS